MGPARAPLTLADIDGLAWTRGADGLLPAVIQHADTLEVLMLAWMDPAALRETLESGEVTFFSRRRGGRWRKGETSGHRLKLVQAVTDCDRDALRVMARPLGPACHEGLSSCFGQADGAGLGVLARLEAVIADRAGVDPASSYTARLLAEGTARAAQKVGEEAVETALAAVSGDDAALCGEAADLLFHLLVLLRARGLGLDAALEVLRRRADPVRA